MTNFTQNLAEGNSIRTNDEKFLQLIVAIGQLMGAGGRGRGAQAMPSC